MAAELSELECVRIAANLNADTVREQQKVIRELEMESTRLRICLGSIYRNCENLAGRKAVQALIDAKTLKVEELL